MRSQCLGRWNLSPCHHGNGYEKEAEIPFHLPTARPWPEDSQPPLDLPRQYSVNDEDTWEGPIREDRMDSEASSIGWEMHPRTPHGRRCAFGRTVLSTVSFSMPGFSSFAVTGGSSPRATQTGIRAGDGYEVTCICRCPSSRSRVQNSISASPVWT
jgi:hypothetical protein